MKKITAILLAAILAAALCACTPIQPRTTAAEPTPFETSRPSRMEEYKENGASISLSVYDSWQCEPYSDGSNFGLLLTPESEPKLTFALAYNKDGFGVCGTGLREESATVAGCNASIGYYDGSDNWDFISIDTGGKNYTVTWSYGGDTVPDDALRTASSEIRSMLSTLSLS